MRTTKREYQFYNQRFFILIKFFPFKRRDRESFSVEAIFINKNPFIKFLTKSSY